jgi:Putative Ig domain
MHLSRRACWDVRSSLAASFLIVIAQIIPAVALAANRPPTISGTPITSIKAGDYYFFRPKASDPEGRTLRFSIANKPAWARFHTDTGQLGGYPTAGTYGNIRISVSDGVNTASLAAFSIKATTSAGSGNTAPKISGTPPSAINAANAYSFQPTASDANGDKLTFSIVKLPSWASFSTSTGRLSGTPGVADVGTYSGIVISVSDGKTSASLAAFSIAVTQNSSGAATLTWVPPTQNTNGSVLTNLSGYRIYYGTSPSALNQTVTLNNAGLTAYVVQNLAPATYYFALKALTSSGAESSLSQTASKTVK